MWRVRWRKLEAWIEGYMWARWMRRGLGVGSWIGSDL